MNASAAALNASSSSSSSSSSGAAAPSSSYSAATVALLSSLVAFLIAFTLAGNVLVVLAVLTSGGPLRAPQNLFLVSLAGADILVAALVMPFSLANELMGGWAFGRAWCRLYLALDVLFCTSSIVHLCAISLDRYWSVTRALEYNGKRTPARVKGAILGVWLLSAAISSPPLLSGAWEEEEEERRTEEGGGGEEGGEPAVEGLGAPSPGVLRCRLNDQTWYILASCVGSFFAPCLVMLLVYLRIYRVAKRRTRRSLSQKRACPDGASVLRPQVQEDEVEDEEEDKEDAIPRASKAPKPRCGRAVGLEDVELEESSPSEGRRGQARRKSRRRHRRCCSSSSSSSSSSASGLPRLGSSVRSVEVSSPSSWQRRRRRRRRGPGGLPGTAVGSRLCPKALSQAREKRFTLVLAVVMGVFVVCWFPFFFSYSLYGICREACRVPETLFKFFFWIGYCNSSLNPVIYTIFNQDFRRSFKHILFGRTRRKIIDRRLFSLH